MSTFQYPKYFHKAGRQHAPTLINSITILSKIQNVIKQRKYQGVCLDETNHILILIKTRTCTDQVAGDCQRLHLRLYWDKLPPAKCHHLECLILR